MQDFHGQTLNLLTFCDTANINKINYLGMISAAPYRTPSVPPGAMVFTHCRRVGQNSVGQRVGFLAGFHSDLLVTKMISWVVYRARKP
jgi:hypothetical protein